MASAEGTIEGSMEHDEKKMGIVELKGEVEDGRIGVDNGKGGQVGNGEEEEADVGDVADKEADEQEVRHTEEKDGVKEEKDENAVEEEGSEGKENDEETEGRKKEESSELKQMEEENTPKTSGKKMSGKWKKSEKDQLQSSMLPGSDRPTRERKTVERYMTPETARVYSNKSVAIEKGRGMLLKDIPNVAFKLSKRKADVNLQLLHTILFGKKAKVHSLKKNIGLFSGFVWAESEGKQRNKIKEKIDKCVKEKMLDFCDVLDIPVNRTTIKEELSAKLLEFLESPRAMTDSLLADREKSKKRKTKGSTSKTPTPTMTEGPSKKQKLDSELGKRSSDGEDDKIEPSQSEDDNDNPKTVPGAESNNDNLNDTCAERDQDQDGPEKQVVVESSSFKKKSKREKSPSAKSKSATKFSGKSCEKPNSVSKKGTAAAGLKGKMNVPLTKKPKVDKENNGQTTGAKTSSSNKKSTKFSTEKDKGVAPSNKEAKKEPSREELLTEVENILKGVDFNTATLSDILKQLGDNFGLDLTYRKREVKEIITEVIQNMSDDEAEEEEHAEESSD